MAVEKAISYDQARKKINKAAPKGHQLAFITPAEAKMLKDKGGSGEMTEAGVKSYKGHTGGHSGKGGQGSSAGSGGGGPGKGTTAGKGGLGSGKKGGKKSAKGAGLKSSKKTSKKSFSDKLKESYKKNEKQQKEVQKNLNEAKKEREAYNKKTGFMTSQGFLKDKYGNLVRSKTQVERVADQKAREKALRDLFASQIQAQEAKQVTPTFSGLQGILDRTRKKLGVGPVSVDKLNELKNINRALGDFDYTGMSIGNQLKAQSSDFAKGIPGLAKAAGLIANPALAIATGGQGVLGLLNNAGTALGLGPKTSTAQPKGFLKGLFEGLQIGEAPALENQKGGQGQDPMAPIIPLPVDDPLKKGPITLPFEGSEEPVLKDEPLGLDRLKELFPIRMAAQDGGVAEKPTSFQDVITPKGKAMFNRLMETGMTEQQAMQRLGEMAQSGSHGLGNIALMEYFARQGMGYGGMAPMSGMMMSESPTVVMNVANSGIGGILEKFKQIRSEM